MKRKVDRKTRVRARLRGKADKPRLSVFISNRHIYAQIIDDRKGETLVAARDKEVDAGKTIEVAQKVGELIAKKAKEKRIKKVVFDRGGHKYHGRVKTLAEAARKEGLEF